MKRHRLVIGALAVALPACVAILGLESGDYESFDVSLCQRYAELCGTSADGLNLGISSDPKICEQQMNARLDASVSDPTRPNVERYTSLHCRSKTTCAEFLDCLGGSSVVTNPSMACATGQCVGEALDSGAKPWRCCPTEHCLPAPDGSVCQADRFACIGNVPPFVKFDPMDMTYFDVRLEFVDINTMQPINSDLVVVACNRLDVQCSGPVATPLTDAGTKPNEVLFRLKRGFDGFIQVKYVPPDGGTNLDYMTLLFFVFPPLDRDFVISNTMNHVPLFQRKSFTDIAMSLNTMVDPKLGSVFGFAVDCSYQLADGVAGGLDTEAGATLYFMGGAPNLKGTSTDPSGQIGFVNVAPGLHTLTTTVRGVRSGSVPIIVRADSLSFGLLPPTP